MQLLRRRVSGPRQYGLAALGGMVAACVTGMLPSIWIALGTADGSGQSALAFAPYILLIASVVGVNCGVLILSVGMLANRITARVSSGPAAPATAAGVAVLVLGLAVALLLAAWGWGFAAWPIVVVTIVGAALVVEQGLLGRRPRS